MAALGAAAPRPAAALRRAGDDERARQRRPNEFASCWSAGGAIGG